MKVEYINPFVEGAQSVIKMLCDVDTRIGKGFLRTSHFSLNQVIIIIGLVGQIKGQVYFELPVNTAMKVASRMMGGLQILELDEMSKSAVSEMGNMIMGNVSTLLYSKDIHIDITPPSLITGENLEISNKAPTIAIPLDLHDYGIININISAEEVA